MFMKGVSAWPYVSCDFGQFDIAGFPKPHAYWYRANWLQNFGPEEPGRPPLPFATVARIINLPGAMKSKDEELSSRQTGQITGITTATFAELIVDGLSAGIIESMRTALGEVAPISWTLPASADINVYVIPF